MATILIPTILEDIHAAAVAVALERMGHRPVRWFCSDLPQNSAASFSIGTQTPALQLHDDLGDLSLADIDVFWHRRIGTPTVTQPIAESDKNMALSESASFLAGVLSTISANAFAVNGYYQARAVENKLVQLSAARELGLRIPQTLVSNDPAKIRDFIARHEDLGAIYKPFKPASWESDGHVAIAFTARVCSKALPSDALLRLAPAIYQAYVPKAYEVRVTCMGAELVAVRLQSQQTKRAAIDWRATSPHDLDIERIELPADVKQQCRAFMRRFGLLFGCFDFIVTPQGEYVFLEINQMGQFLWVEEANRNIPLLQMFCDFLVSCDAEFTYRAKSRELSFLDVAQQAVELIDVDVRVHLRPQVNPNVYRE